MIGRALVVGGLLLSVSLCGWSEDHPEYDVSAIPQGMRLYAPAVVRQHLITFRVYSKAKAEETHRVVYTIFRREGNEFGEIDLSYDRFSSIDDLSGALYDEHGHEIRELSRADVKDESDISASSLYSDARVRRAELLHDQYPYTVEFTYTIIKKGLVNYPSWFAQEDEEAVEHTRFEVVLPADQELRYWTSSPAKPPVVSLQDDGRHYVWEATGLKEMSDDDLDDDIEIRTAAVRIAPQDFEIEGITGSLGTWKTFGSWVARLYAGKDQLPVEAVRDVDSVTRGISSPVEKAEHLYRYMQGRTRYVNVELGVGGWEPYNAAYVHERGYGDCKALSNYMVALLKCAGIRSYPAVVYAGGLRSNTLEEFPENRFNHVIVCVPHGADSLWLECTSQVVPFGYLGDFTENRPALLITPEGGVLVHTPFSPSSLNTVHRVGRVTLNSLGNAHGELTTRRTGNLAEHARNVMTFDSPQDREEWVLRDLDVSGAGLKSYTVTGVAEHGGVVTLSTVIDMPSFASVSGSRLFLIPDIAHRNGVPPKEHKTRRSPIRFHFPYVSVDSIQYAFPEGFKCEAIPPAIRLDASFGSYRSQTIAIGERELLHVRTIEIRSPVIPPEHYEEYVKFMKEVVKADKAQAILTRSM